MVLSNPATAHAHYVILFVMKIQNGFCWYVYQWAKKNK